MTAHQTPAPSNEQRGPSFTRWLSIIVLLVGIGIVGVALQLNSDGPSEVWLTEADSATRAVEVRLRETFPEQVNWADPNRRSTIRRVSANHNGDTINLELRMDKPENPGEWHDAAVAYVERVLEAIMTAPGLEQWKFINVLIYAEQDDTVGTPVTSVMLERSWLEADAESGEEAWDFSRPAQELQAHIEQRKFYWFAVDFAAPE